MPAKRRWIKIGLGVGVVTVAAIISIVVVLIVHGSRPDLAKPSITVEEIINRVDTDRPRQGGVKSPNFMAAQAGQELTPGDRLMTFQNSQARVDITVREFLRVVRTTSNTLWRLGQFDLDQDTIIELDHGKLFILDEGVQSEDRPLEIVTPAGTASPRGTWMSVEYDKKTGETKVNCFRGSCALENEFGKQVMTDEQKSISRTNEKPTRPVFLDEEEKQSFLKLPEAKQGEVRVPTPVVIPPTSTPTRDLAPTERTPDTTILTPMPVSTPTFTPRPTLTNTPEPTPTPTSEPTSTPQPTPTPTPQPTPTLGPVALPAVDTRTIPHVFVGSVRVDGQVAADGTEVSAWVSDYTSAVGEGNVSDGSYVMNVSQYGSASFAGKTLTFKISDADTGQTYTWEKGGATVLDLVGD
jgi:hypothetical protein